jgi:hypothetical protein
MEEIIKERNLWPTSGLVQDSEWSSLLPKWILRSFKDGAGGYTPLSFPLSPLMASSSFLQEPVQAVFEFLLPVEVIELETLRGRRDVPLL